MRFRRAYKKPVVPDAPSGRSAAGRQQGDAGHPAGNRALERELKGGGEPLPGGIRTQMEEALGGTFKDVRIHTGPDASRQAQQAGASAFTRGKDIVFDKDQYRPGTIGGDALLAHELAHVQQQRGATTKGKESAALEADATKAAVRGIGGFFGGLRARLAGAGPALKSGLALQRCSCGGAQKLPAKAGPGKSGAKAAAAGKAPAGAAAAPADPLAAEKQSLAKALGLSRVADGDAKWKADELAKARRILGQIPADAKAAIQGVALVRMQTPNCPGGDPAGCFRSIVNPTTGDREDVIEIGDKAFTDDEMFEKKKGDKNVDVTASRTDASGATITALPSEDVFAHEVGHALETAVSRKAEAARFKADLAVTPAHNKLQKAVRAFTIPGVAGISNASAAELAYTAALVNVSKALNSVNQDLQAMPDDPKSKHISTALTNIGKQKGAVQKAIAARDKAKAKLPAGSSAPQPSAETGQDAALKTINDILAALKDLSDAQKVLEQNEAAEAASKAKVPGEGKEKIETSRRLAELVAIVAIKKIDVKNSKALRDYPKDHWPHEPEELYADLFQMSLTEPGGLKVFDPDVAAYFQQPIGVKNPKLKKSVDAWIKKQK